VVRVGEPVQRQVERSLLDGPGRGFVLLAANSDLNKRSTRASVRATIPALFPEKADQPWGYLDPVQWRNFGGWMVDNKLLNDLPDINSAITGDLLPGAGL